MPVEENNVWIIKTTNESTFECWEFFSIELILTCIITYACTSVHMHIQTHSVTGDWDVGGGQFGR